MRSLSGFFHAVRDFFAPRRREMDVQRDIPDQRFADVAALEEAVESLRGLADVLKHPDKYARYGARTPRGVLLYGPPGTGKTLLARALAGEAGVPFYAVSGSDFVQMYVGVGASRVRALFKKARKAGRGVIFIDEIDALGSRREGSGNEEREQTINALLTEMSGFRGGEGILVLAATNRPEKLDAALTRPGRFDRQIEVGMPDRAGRRQILQVHARGKPLSAQVDIDRLAADTVSFSGAKLESMLNEAALRAARRNTGEITAGDVDAALRAVLVGEDRLNRPGAPQERRITAFHEAGHALATLLFDPQSRLARVSIIPSTRGAAGYSMAVPPDRMLLTRAQAEAAVCVALAGRAAEELVFGRAGVTTGIDIRIGARDGTDRPHVPGMGHGRGSRAVCAAGAGALDRRRQPCRIPGATKAGGALCPHARAAGRPSRRAGRAGRSAAGKGMAGRPRGGSHRARKMSDESHPKRINPQISRQDKRMPKGKKATRERGHVRAGAAEAGTRGVSANRDTVTVQIEGELDHCSAERVRASLDRAD